MTTDNIPHASDPKQCPISFERNSPEFRENFVELTEELHQKRSIAWAESYGGFWVANDMSEVFDIARRSDALSNDNDIEGVKNGYHGIQIPPLPEGYRTRGGFLEMDPPEQQDYRKSLNAYLSPAAIMRWIPVIDEITRACIDERIESGTIDFIDHLANIVPAVITMGLLGMPMRDWDVYCEPVHAQVYTDPTSPAMFKVMEQMAEVKTHLSAWIDKIADEPRPGLIDALHKMMVNGQSPTTTDKFGVCQLLIGGGFDTTTALTSHALEWLSEHPDERARLHENLDTMLDPATEEFLRFYTPAQGDGRTVSADIEVGGASLKEGDRLWLSWAMANRNAEVFPNPHEIDLERTGNRHTSFGLGIHRCIGSNVARNLFKRMLTQVLDRIPDYVCEPEGAVHYPSIGFINGMQKLPATFTPGHRIGTGLEETIERMQKVVDEQRLADPVTKRKQRAEID